MALWIWQWTKSFGDNFGIVVPGGLFRSAEPSKKKLAEYRDKYGIKALLNLRAEVTDEERQEVEALALKWYAVPMKDDEAPTDAQIRQALSIMKWQTLPLLVSCRGGRHRTSVVIACFRVAIQDWTKRDAWNEAKDFGFYGYGGHQIIEDWFFHDFDPQFFKA